MEASQRFEHLRRLLRADPVNLSLLRDCVGSAIESRYFDEAVIVATEGLVQFPNDEAILFGLASAHIGRGDFQGAVGGLAYLHALYPDNLAIGQNLALCKYSVGDFAGARDYLEPLYACGEKTVGVLRLLISSCHHLGLLDRAVKFADDNKETGRSDSALAGVYSLVYLDADRAIDALKFSTYSLRADPLCIDAITTAATLRLSEGHVDSADRMFSAILNRKSDVGRAWIGLGSIALLKRDYEDAKTKIGKGVELMPLHLGSWHLLGWTHLAANEIDAAERVFQHAMDINRNFAENHGALATIAALRGNAVQAQEMIDVALRLDPACLSAQFAQSLLAARSGREELARDIIENAMKVVAVAGGAGGARLLAVAEQSNKLETKNSSQK